MSDPRKHWRAIGLALAITAIVFVVGAFSPLVVALMDWLEPLAKGLGL